MKFLLFLFILISIGFGKENLLQITPRENISLKIFENTTQNAKANIILFSRGKGNHNISNSSFGISIESGKNNFLLIANKEFLKKNYNTYLLDSPSDKKDYKGLNKGFRNTTKHLNDIIQVINKIKENSNLPIWLIGSVEGTQSVVNVAINKSDFISGLILISPLSQTNDDMTSLLELAINKISKPTLIITHENNRCQTSSAEGTYDIEEILDINNKLVESIDYDDEEPEEGSGPICKIPAVLRNSLSKSNPCGDKSYNNLYGREELVVFDIDKFIKKYQDK